jgi:hypothetical protein
MAEEAGKSISILAIVALILAIIFAPAGLILGIIAWYRINHHPRLTGKGVAIAAVVIGGVLTFAQLAVIALVGMKISPWQAFW